MKRKLLFVVNVDWFFISHRLPIALEALNQGYEVHLATSLTDKHKELYRLGFNIYPISLDRSDSSLLGLANTFWQILRVYKTVQPDLVHLVTIKPVLLGGLAARMSRVPAVVSAISGLGLIFVDRGLKARIRRWLVARLYKMAFFHPNSRIIFQNADDRNSLMSMLKLPESKVTLIPGSGADLTKFCFEPLPTGVPIILLAARLLIEKGVRDFYQSALMLRQRGWSKKDVRFVIVGAPDPDNPHSLKQSELNIWEKEGTVELWGLRNDMPKVLQSASIIVLPSYYGEGLPKILIEAGACGRAIVTTDHPGCRDAILADVSGVLVPVRDPGSLADALEELLNNPLRIESMGKEGRKLAEITFDEKLVVADHIKIYEDLLHNRSINN